jgi:hypothetical protein
MDILPSSWPCFASSFLFSPQSHHHHEAVSLPCTSFIHVSLHHLPISLSLIRPVFIYRPSTASINTDFHQLIYREARGAAADAQSPATTTATTTTITTTIIINNDAGNLLRTRTPPSAQWRL